MNTVQPGPYRLVLSTCPDRQNAEAIAAGIVKDGLAACVSIIPGLRSVYMWQGKVENSDEYLLLIKTHAHCYNRLETVIRRCHPYELPEIVSVPIETGLAEYLAWIDASVTKDQDIV